MAVAVAVAMEAKPMREPPAGSLSPLHELAAQDRPRAAEQIERLVATWERDNAMSAEDIVTAINLRANDSTHTGGYAALHYACQNGNPEVVGVLLKHGANPNAVKNNGSTPLLCSLFMFGRADLPGFGASNGEVECMARHAKVCAQLLAAPEFDLKLNDYRGGTHGNSPIWHLVSNVLDQPDSALPLLKEFLRRGFDPNGTLHQQPAVHVAIYNGHSESAEALMIAGADASAIGVFGDFRGTAIEFCEWACEDLDGEERSELYAFAQHLKNIVQLRSSQKHAEPELAEPASAISCAACGACKDGLKACSRCHTVKYCSRDCQRNHWKTHKPICSATTMQVDRSLVSHFDAMGSSHEAVAVRAEALAHRKETHAHAKQLKQHTRDAADGKLTMMNMSMTAFGPVGPGMPLPDGVPRNFALKQAANNALQLGPAKGGSSFEGDDPKGRGNLKGESLYKDYFDDIVANREQWMVFFDHRENAVHAEHTCGILGTLATIYRQRDVLTDCEEVLDMELEVLTRYQRSVAGTAMEQVRCCERLTFLYQMIRYNLCFQTQRYEQCVELFRELAAHELKTGVDFKSSGVLVMVPAILDKPPTAAVLRKLTDAEVMQIVKAPLHNQAATGVDHMRVAERKKRVALAACAVCHTQEAAMDVFKKCRGCKEVVYCGKACQKKDWKTHKKVCNTGKH